MRRCPFGGPQTLRGRSPDYLLPCSPRCLSDCGSYAFGGDPSSDAAALSCTGSDRLPTAANDVKGGRGRPSYFFSVSIQSTRALMSASDTCALGGIGICPHTPVPPFFTFSTSIAAALASPLYFAATSWYAGPTTFLSIE